MSIAPTFRVNIPSGWTKQIERQVEEAALLGIEASLEEGQTYVRNHFTLIPRSLPGDPPAIDTGNLYRHIETKMIPGKRGWGSLSARTHYAVYLEFGTSKMAARPFMLPAAVYLSKKVPEIVMTYIRLALGK